jgi:hypothetical protein
MRGLCSIALLAGVAVPSAAQVKVPSPEDQIAAAVLPLPTVLQAGAWVRGYTPDLKLVLLREGTNSLVCTADRPGDDEFDVRCYDRDFRNVMDRRHELERELVDTAAVEARFLAELRDGRLRMPSHPTAGYRMLGPIAAYDPATRTFTDAIDRWQSIHFPYRTAEELGLPTKQEGTMPFVMASGTWWSHVMIVHPNR